MVFTRHILKFPSGPFWLGPELCVHFTQLEATRAAFSSVVVHLVDISNSCLHDSTSEKFAAFWVIIIATTAMAIGDASVTEGHVPQLQPSAKLYKPSLEPEPTWTKDKKSNP